jgi:hypothetical protein
MKRITKWFLKGACVLFIAGIICLGFGKYYGEKEYGKNYWKNYRNIQGIEWIEEFMEDIWIY